MKIRIDTREPPEIEMIFQEIVAMLYTGTGINVEIIKEQLETGDWILVDNDGRDLEPLVVERKHIDPETRSNDMISSRNDGRWDSQKQDLINLQANVMYGVTGWDSSMPVPEQKSIATYIAGLWKQGIKATWLPSDYLLVYESIKYFEMSPEYIPTHKIVSDYDKNIEFCARILYQKEGISKSTALALAKIIKIPAEISYLNPEQISQVIRVVQGKALQPKPTHVAVELYCQWHDVDLDEFVRGEKEKYKKDRSICRFCGGCGKLYLDTDELKKCPECAGTGKKNKKKHEQNS